MDERRDKSAKKKRDSKKKEKKKKGATTGINIVNISMHIWNLCRLNAFQISLIKQTGGQPSCCKRVLKCLYLQKGYDKRSQREVGGFLQLGVKFFDGQSGILEKRETQKTNT